MSHHNRYQVSDCQSQTYYPQQGGFCGGDVYADMRQNYRPPERMNSQQYEQKVESTFTSAHRITDSNNYRENLWTAAENQKPVVMVFGRGNADEGPVLDAVARAKQAAGTKAEFMYVDLNKVDPQSPIGQYAQYIGRPPFGTPMTMVFTQKQGEGNTPVIPERPLHWQVGQVNEQTLMAGIDRAKQIQESYGPIKTGREKKPDVPPEPDDKPNPKPDQKKEAGGKDVFQEALKPWGEQKVDDVFKNVPVEKRGQAILDAIKEADATGNPAVRARVRAVVGLASIHWGTEADQAGRKEDAMSHYIRGCEFLMNAGEIQPDIMKYPGFQKALQDSKLPGDAGKFLIEQTATNPSWFRPTDPSQYGQKWEEYMNSLYSHITGKTNVQNDPLLNAVKDRFKPRTNG